ncbi:MAG: c-type cytochrome [Hydrogenovibrio sp.]|nr:c-type cytochrome [Hydrogenovibrio sp.]
MRKLWLLCLACLSVEAFASEHAIPSAPAWSQITWDQTAKSMPKGDVQRGAELHKYGLCVSCHGEQGIAPSRNAPNLAGNTPLYTYKTLLDYQSGLRHEGNGKAQLMHAATQPLSKQDMADLAAFYATQRLPSTGKSEVPDPIKKLVTKGDVSRMITPCASCHGVHGEGNKITPALAGQVPSYFVRTMQAYQQGLRTNDIDEGMSQFAHDLTTSEIQALANYYARLTPKHTDTKE